MKLAILAAEKLARKLKPRNFKLKKTIDHIVIIISNPGKKLKMPFDDPGNGLLVICISPTSLLLVVALLIFSIGYLNIVGAMVIRV